MNLKQLTTVLIRLFATGRTVELEGGPGIGKTQAITHPKSGVLTRLSTSAGEPVGLVYINLPSIDIPDARGFMMPHMNKDTGVLQSIYSTPPFYPSTTNIEVFYPDGTHKMASSSCPLDVPRLGVLMLDERRQAPPDLQKAIAPTLHNGRMGEFMLGDLGHWVVWTATNRETDRSGVFKDMAFIEDRIATRLQVDADQKAWMDWAEVMGVHPMCIYYARKAPGKVFHNTVPDKPGKFATPRSLTALSDLQHELGLDFPELGEVVHGAIGESSGLEYMQLLRVKDEVPDLEDIIDNPGKAKVPDRSDAQLFTLYMCIHGTTSGNVMSIFKYLARLPKEFQVVATEGIMRSTPDVTNNPEFGAWLNENKSLVIATLGDG